MQVKLEVLFDRRRTVYMYAPILERMEGEKGERY
jgi:hypothetical protein